METNGALFGFVNLLKMYMLRLELVYKKSINKSICLQSSSVCMRSAGRARSTLILFRQILRVMISNSFNDVDQSCSRVEVNQCSIGLWRLSV